MWCAADNNNYMCLICTKGFLESNFNTLRGEGFLGTQDCFLRISLLSLDTLPILLLFVNFVFVTLVEIKAKHIKIQFWKIISQEIYSNRQTFG